MIHDCVLTIAGSDSGGNAGVQADLRAFHSYSLHGCTVFAALTAQNPFGVSAIHPVPAQFVAAQLDAVLGTYSIKALKTGMLSDPAVIEVVASRLAKRPEIVKVIDPVMVATSGAALATAPAVAAIRKHLIPLATVITPNIPEAGVLLERSGVGAASDAGAMRDTARALAERYGIAVLLKGGHGDGPVALDVLCDRDGNVTEYAAERIANPVSTHGTGCSLAAALAAELALGRPLAAAVAGAKEYVRQAIEGSYLVGPNGCGVLGFVEGR